MRQIAKVEVTSHKVKLVIEDRDVYGRKSKSQQMTFRRRHFEQAMANAGITVPWSKVRP